LLLLLLRVCEEFSGWLLLLLLLLACLSPVI